MDNELQGHYPSKHKNSPCEYNGIGEYDYET